jgi:hypothetical protein
MERQTIEKLRSQVVLQWASAQESDKPRLAAAGISEALICAVDDALRTAREAVSGLPVDYVKTCGYELRVTSKGIVGSRVVLEGDPRHLEILEHWQKAMKVDLELNDERRRKISGRLRDGFTVDRLKTAITIASRDKFIQGQNDRGQWYGDFKTIFKNKGAVERLLVKAGRRRPHEPIEPKIKPSASSIFDRCAAVFSHFGKGYMTASDFNIIGRALGSMTDAQACDRVRGAESIKAAFAFLDGPGGRS